MQDNGLPSLTPTKAEPTVPHKSQLPDPRTPKTTALNKDAGSVKPRGKIQLPESLDVWKEQPSHMPLPRGDFPSAITPYRVWMHKLIRFQPIAQVTPENVVRQLDMWYAGTLRYFAMMMDAVARRDDVLQSVIPKRKAALARREFQIIADDTGDPVEAAKHKCVLDYFYKNLIVTHAIDMNQRRGVKLLIENILDAHMMKYSTHEVLWRPTNDKVELTFVDPETQEVESLGFVPGLTATMNFVPQWFFENRTGKLRFLQEDFSYDGVDMEDGAWLVAVGQGVMEAAVVAYMFKKLAMQEWLTYMQRQATPGIVGKVDAAEDSERWNGMVKAVQDFVSGFGMVINKNDEMDKIDVGSTGQLPFPSMIERMDRVLATLMRGQDLSTMSAHHTAGGSGGGQGASLQGAEEHIVETDDANFVNETLQLSVDPLVIAYFFGEGTKPLARATVVVPEDKDESGLINKLTYGVNAGLKIGKRWAAEQLGLQDCAADDEPLEPIQPAQPLNDPEGSSANERAIKTQVRRYRANGVRTDKELIKNSDQLFQGATYKSLQPLVDRILGVMELPDAGQDYGLHRLLEDLPGITRQINADPEGAVVLRNAMAAGWFNSVISSAVEHHTQTRPAAANEGTSEGVKKAWVTRHGGSVEERDKHEMISDAHDELKRGGIQKPSAAQVRQHIHDVHGVKVDRTTVVKHMAIHKDDLEMVHDAVKDLKANGIAKPTVAEVRQHITDNHGVSMNKEEVAKYFPA